MILKTRYLIYIFLSIFIISLNSCKKNNKIATIEAPADFAKAYSINSHFDENSSELKVEVILQPGFHAYARGEPIGKPVNLVIKEENGWVAQGEPMLPAGEKKTLGAGTSSVLDGTFFIVQPAKKGKSPGRALLYLQICTDTQCDRPRTHEIIFN